MTFPDPLVIAQAHQKNIVTLREKLMADVGCIRQLLVGREVRRRSDHNVFTVTEVKLDITTVDIRGKLSGKGRTRYIGTVATIELVAVQP
jgi:hypothetical protein